MTLVVAVTGQRSIWLLTDRRISYQGRKPNEDARKLLLLETTDGVALLGYAGLGSTALGTEPGDWMSRVLRSRSLPLERSLEVLAEAVRSQLPRHLETLPDSRPPSHNVIIPAFLRGEPRFYSIDVARRSGHYFFRVTRHVTGKQTKLGQVAPRVMIGGSGAVNLKPRNTETPRWVRELLHIVKAHDSGRVSPQTVAAHLARLNYQVHLDREKKPDKSVGPCSIIAWRLQQGGRGQELFCGPNREISSTLVRLPTITNGWDINDIIQVAMPHVMAKFEAMRRGESKVLDKDTINAELARLPDKPDESMA